MTSIESSDIERYRAFLPDVVHDVIAVSVERRVTEDAVKRITTMLHELLPKTRLRKSIFIFNTARVLLGRDLTADEFKELGILGWLIELLTIYVNVSDDVMDEGVTRRGEPCWHRRPGIGLSAFNDCTLIRSTIFILLKNHFKKHACYEGLLESFHEICFRFDLGQESDLVASNEQDPTCWTEQDLIDTGNLKWSSMIFYPACLLALQYVGLATPENVQQVEHIVNPLGRIYLYANDVLDVFGDSQATGRIGTDIKDNKRSWVVIQALKCCDEKQRQFIQKSYGKCNATVAEELRQLFKSLHIVERFDREEDELITHIRNQIESLDQRMGLAKNMFLPMVDAVYRSHKKGTSFANKDGW